MTEVFEEIKKTQKKRERRGEILFYLLFFGTVIPLGFYFAELLFGKNSLNDYVKVSEKERVIQREVLNLREENSRLQKEYFELKDLEPQ